LPYKFHENRELYFNHQTLTTQKYIIPFIEKEFPVKPDMGILEIGCAEAGVLKAFLDKGCNAVGVDLSTRKLNIAKSILTNEIEEGRLTLINKNIYEKEFRKKFVGKFNLIILKDVIEHIPDQQNLIGFLSTFLKPNGVIFFSFPPWQMPFGGHQQMCNNKILSIFPYFHLLPMKLYNSVLRLFGEPEEKIKGLSENKKTGISIERFEKIIKNIKYHILQKQFFLVNPIYEYKFNLKPRVQLEFINSIPLFRNFVTTCVYYLIKP